MFRLIGVSLVGILILGQIAWISLRDLQPASRHVQSCTVKTSASQGCEDQCVDSVTSTSTSTPTNEPLIQLGSATEEVRSDFASEARGLSVSSTAETPLKHSPNTPVALNELVHETIVHITLPGSASTGTGFISKLREDGFEVVTAAHVVRGNGLSNVVHSSSVPSIEVTSFFPQESDTVVGAPSQALYMPPKGRVHRMVWLTAQNTVQDVAVLRVVSRERPKRSMRLVSSQSLDGSNPATPFDAWHVRWLSNDIPALGRVSVLRDQLVQRDSKTPESRYWICSPASEPGMSGGPLLMSDGSVLGLASGNSSGESYYVPSEYIAQTQARSVASEMK